MITSIRANFPGSSATRIFLLIVDRLSFFLWLQELKHSSNEENGDTINVAEFGIKPGNLVLTDQYSSHMATDLH